MGAEGAIAANAIRNKIVRKFREQCATDPRQAMTLESLAIRNRNITRRLIKENVLVEVSNDRFYLDEDAYEAYARKKRRGIIIGLLAALAGGLVAYLLHK